MSFFLFYLFIIFGLYLQVKKDRKHVEMEYDM